VKNYWLTPALSQEKPPSQKSLLLKEYFLK
jgi:hypothetical protein